MARNLAPFRTPHVFDTSAEAVEFFNAEREEGVDPIPSSIADFLASIDDYDPDAVFNVQPGFKTHYIACARPEDHHPWLFAKPTGVVFQLGDERNVDAVLDMWGTSQLEVPSVMPTDMWFGPQEVGMADDFPAVDFCLRLAAQWAVRAVGSRS